MLIIYLFLRVQNISQQVASYMRDPSRMIKRMQLRRSTVGVLGEVSFFFFLGICLKSVYGQKSPNILRFSKILPYGSFVLTAGDYLDCFFAGSWWSKQNKGRGSRLILITPLSLPIYLLKLTDLERTCDDAFWIISGKRKEWKKKCWAYKVQMKP